ncbi:serine/threonine-protein kinase [Actinoallomurus iriomotensis]|uniref:serine/threonine-protein kinase n=1 Tax=Actinoallomurus iriomotensis TaxID=478107 RepID=UPI002553C889|nr:serine/threonine-protein kinase [Actinoallomurus iriomotensis]
MSDRRRLADRYVLHEPPIGAGGMGTVWRAYDELLHREVAIKELRLPESLSAAEREALRERAMTEARAAAGLHHPAIVPVHDVLDEDDRPWIVMHLVEGRALDEEVTASGPLDPRRTAEIGLRLLDALTAAHAKGVLHRDVKPQNVLLDADGNAVLTDFGIAAVTGATRGLTQDGSLVGTLGYVAPERLSGGKAVPASDLWSLGATLYYAVEGRPAYGADDPAAVVAAVLTSEPDAPRRAGALWPVIQGLLDRDPGRRLDPEESRRRLRAVTSGRSDTPTVRLPGSASNPPTKVETALLPPPSLRARLRDRMALVTTGVVVLVVVAVALANWLATSNGGSATAQGGGSTPTPATQPSASQASPSPTPPAARFRLAPNVCKGRSKKSTPIKQLVPQAAPNYEKWTELSDNITCKWENLKKGDDNFSWPELQISAKRYADVDKAIWDYSTDHSLHADDDVIRSLTDIGDEAFFAHKERGFPGVEVGVRISNVFIAVSYEYDSDKTIKKSDEERLLTLARQLVQQTEATAE